MRKVSPPTIDHRLSAAAARTLALQNACGQFESASDTSTETLSNSTEVFVLMLGGSHSLHPQ
jgi:hypothetical protein